MAKQLLSKTLFVSLALLLAGLYLTDPIAQNPEYHLFADQRSFAGIPNTWDVLSNLVFIVIGFYGLIALRSLELQKAVIQLARVFYVGLILTGIGSAFYHLSPTNESLICDRIPMTISFMAFFSFIVSQHISLSTGYRLLWVLIPLGIFSVIYWGYTEHLSRGDLRLYALVQFLPMILIPVIISVRRNNHYNTKSVWFILVLYLMSKLFEHYDSLIFSWLGMSGHTLKHIIAALTGILFTYTLSSLQKHTG